jgi:hypothetical protein
LDGARRVSAGAASFTITRLAAPETKAHSRARLRWNFAQTLAAVLVATLGLVRIPAPPRGVELFAPVPHRGPPVKVARAAPPAGIGFSGAD